MSYIMKQINTSTNLVASLCTFLHMAVFLFILQSIKIGCNFVIYVLWKCIYGRSAGNERVSLSIMSHYLDSFCLYKSCLMYTSLCYMYLCLPLSFLRFIKGKDIDNWVTIEPMTGKVSTAKVLDRESPFVQPFNSTYTVILHVVDDGKLFNSSNVYGKVTHTHRYIYISSSK